MKFPTYAEAKNTGYDRAEYRIDWETGERKYKEIHSGVRVYENDLVCITRNGRNDPYWRNELANRFGCHFAMLSELVYKTLHDPESGSRVYKSQLVDTLYFHDVERSRLYKVGQYGQADIQFVSKYAQPSVLDGIVYYLPNKVAEVAMHDSLVEHYALGVTLNALRTKVGGLVLRTKVGGLDWSAKAILRCQEPIPTDLTNPSTQRFCQQLAGNHFLARTLVQKASLFKVSTHFINVRDKE